MNPASIFHIDTPREFETAAWQLFEYQYTHNPLYHTFCNLLHRPPGKVSSLEEIPFLPIQFFKTHTVLSGSHSPQLIFTSSGTTGSLLSKHYITDAALYKNSSLAAFQHFYGSVANYTILALLPSYLERNNSSLVYMVNHLIRQSNHPESGFFLHNLDELAHRLREIDKRGEPVLLIGVSFALLNLIEKYTFRLHHTIIMETGGMKGRRKELTRAELHQLLREGFGVETIHSEYGMTELLSQAYSQKNGNFQCPPWMKIFIRETSDPLQLLPTGKTGGINVIDLANRNSCAFIATEDLGKVYENGSFEVLGRYDQADVRGCNLLINN